jgi:hypothetical protein
VLALACAGSFLLRGPLLRAAGSALLAEDSISRADVIVVAIDSGAAGVLEASDLFHNGISSRVAIFVEEPDAVDKEFIRRGFHYEDQSQVWVRMLETLGVTQVERIPMAASGTESEGRLLPEWCMNRRYQSVIVVTAADHSRRVRRVLTRAVQGRGITVIVRRARFSSFNPDVWWQTRDGLRVGIVEWEKLLLDFLRHPSF